MKPLILNAEPEGYCDEAKNILKEFGEVIELPLNRSKLIEIIPDFDALIVRLGFQVDRELLERAVRLKVIASPTTGLNHIDIEEVTKRNITIISLKGEKDFLDTITATAELSWGLLLSLVRNIPSASKHVELGKWKRGLFIGKELSGKHLGIVGFGRLGTMIAKYGKAFRMKILAYDLNIRERINGVKFVSLKELLSHSDIVSIHLPLNESTYGFLGRNEISMMKKGSYLVNTSRGEILDEVALLEALARGRIRGAALDVLSGERSDDLKWLEKNPLIQYAREHSNLLITPHIGGATYDSMRKTEIFIAKKLRDFFYLDR